MSMLKPAIVAAGIVIAASVSSGCAGRCTGNPATDGLGCAMVSQGKYERDAIAAEDRADDAAYDAAAAADENARARAELDRKQGERKALQERVKRANREIAMMDGQLRAKRAALSDAEYRLRAMELDRLRAEQEALSRAPDTPETQREIRELEEDIAKLRRILE